MREERLKRKSTRKCIKCLGVGSTLINKELIRNQVFEGITLQAGRLRAQVI